MVPNYMPLLVPELGIFLLWSLNIVIFHLAVFSFRKKFTVNKVACIAMPKGAMIVLPSFTFQNEKCDDTLGSLM